jgi:conjugative element/phage-associated large polyvalent protein
MRKPRAPLFSLQKSRGTTAGSLLTDEEADELIAIWLGYGHKENTIQKEDGFVSVTLEPGTVLQVRKHEVTFDGEVTDDAIAAGLRHAQEAWGGRMYATGPEEFKLRAWAMAQVAGMEIVNYSPPPELMKKARYLVGKYQTEMFNRGNGWDDGGTLEGGDSRPWGYRAAKAPETLPRDPAPLRRRSPQANPQQSLR